MMESLDQMSMNDKKLVSDIQKMIDEEEQSDNTMRQQHGNNWNRMPSSALNSNFKTALIDYKSKLQVAENTDQIIK